MEEWFDTVRDQRQA
jgi:hypothetical protein